MIVSLWNLGSAAAEAAVNFQSDWKSLTWHCSYGKFSIVMMTSSKGNIFRVTGNLSGESPVTGEFPTQRPVTRSFDVFFDLHLNKRLSKQSWGWWFQRLPRPLWRHSNGTSGITLMYMGKFVVLNHNRARPSSNRMQSYRDMLWQE